MFRSYHCEEETLISKQKLTEILNKQANLNLHQNFSSSIIEEIWGQAETTSRGESTILTFSKIFAQAMKILEDRISIIDGPTGLKQNSQNSKIK
jgi:Ca2+-binding EF-hand superfamily protein